MSTIEEVERGLLAILHHGSTDVRQSQAIIDVAHLSSIDFSTPAVGALWDLFVATISSGYPINLTAILSRAEKSEAIKAAGGEKFIRDWFAEVRFPSPKMAQEYADIIRDASLKRRACELMVSQYKAIKAQERNASEIIQSTIEKLQALSNRVPTLRSLAEDVDDLIQEMEDVANGHKASCIPTGIEPLDEIIGGLQASVLTMIVALPAIGKSALLASILYSLTERRIKVGFFSLEDERRWLTNRCTAAFAGVPLFNINTKRDIRHVHVDKMKAEKQLIKDIVLDAIVDDRGGLGPADVIESAKDMIVNHGCQVLMLDHLGEIRMSRSDRYDLDVADVLSQLRNLAKQYKIPIVVAAHAKRRQGLTEIDAPTLTDFANSSAPERMARVIIGLSKIEGVEGAIRASIIKQTNGPSGQHINLEFKSTAGILTGELLNGSH